MTRFWRWLVGLATAVGGLGLALMGLNVWWRQRQLRAWKARKLQELNAERIATAERQLEIDVEQAETEAEQAIRDEQDKRVKEVYDEHRSLSDRLRDAGAGAEPVVGDPPSDS